MQPYILGLLIWHFDPRATSTPQEAYLYASGMIIIAIVSAFITHHSNLGLMEIGMRVRIASSSLMYRKVIQPNFFKPCKETIFSTALTSLSLSLRYYVCPNLPVLRDRLLICYQTTCLGLTSCS